MSGSRENMRLDLAEHLTTLVKNRYNTAKANGSLIFSHTELTVVKASNVPYQLRYCPALSKKPEPQKEPPSDTAKPEKKFNPFEDPTPDLLIAELPRTNTRHRLVLNKYPVIPHHFILATKAFKEQSNPLEEDDLATAFACLQAWAAPQLDGERRKLFAFFNSGEHSGASQPHRHIQFLPITDMVGEAGGQGWRILADELKATSEHSPASYDIGDPPFVYFRRELPERPTSDELHEIYRWLYDRAVSYVRSAEGGSASEALNGAGTGAGAAEISYNLALTTSSMVICPRRREGGMVRSTKAEEQEVGPINVNGTILGGTLMVKTEDEWDALRRDESQLVGLLENIGYPSKSRHTSSTERL
ncbi:MAG: hypothetical protein M4579_000841 [Chaenotheca gracillima]|nr:MAG: hypothetical protein M4579_000841 [Chaenotheca gracillima]